jgi:urease accessory protein UreF
MNEAAMAGITEREKEWALKVSRFLKAELKRAGIGYRELAERLNKHGLEETEGGIAAKLARGTFAVTFFLAVLAVLELEGVTLADL